MQGSVDDEVLSEGFTSPVLLVDLQLLTCCDSAMDPTLLWTPAWKLHQNHEPELRTLNVQP